jgi:hypothetical protein
VHADRTSGGARPLERSVRAARRWGVDRRDDLVSRVLDAEPVPDLAADLTAGGGRALAIAVETEPDDQIDTIAASGLRGPGGADFPQLSNGARWPTAGDGRANCGGGERGRGRAGHVQGPGVSSRHSNACWTGSDPCSLRPASIVARQPLRSNTSWVATSALSEPWCTPNLIAWQSKAPRIWHGSRSETLICA